MKRLRAPAQPLILALALLFLALLLRSQWAELRQFDWQLRPGLLLLSAGLLSASWLLEVWMWRFGLACLGGHLAFPAAVRVWFASILVRYIPGNIWQPLGMTVLARDRGVQPEATVTSIALYQAVNLLAVLPFAGLLIGWLGALPAGIVPPLPVGSPLLTALALLPLLLFLLRPGLLLKLLNWALAKARRPRLTADLHAGQMAVLLLAALADWLLWGLGFAALAAAVLSPGQVNLPGQLLLLLGAYPVAYAVGYLSLLTPGGLAVREGALVLLLAPALGTAPATVAALAMRIWQALLELLWAGAVAAAGWAWPGATRPQPNG